jgi:hypothetical protein
MQILLAQEFSEKPKLVLLRLNSSKNSPHYPPDFLKRCWVLIDLSEYGFKFGKLYAAKGNSGKKSAMEKKLIFLNKIFHY